MWLVMRVEEGGVVGGEGGGRCGGGEGGGRCVGDEGGRGRCGW